ncbi:MAG: S1C family serine protease [Anaerolineales bacterium]|jgi:serine protease Do
MKNQAFPYLILFLLVGIVAGLAGVIAGSLAVYTALSDQTGGMVQAATELPKPTMVISTDQPAQIVSLDQAVTHAVESVGPAVVTVVGTIPGGASFFGVVPDSSVSGSGVFISSEGYLVTNNHVLEDANKVIVILADGTEKPAEIIGTEKYADLAILKVEGGVPSVATLGNSDGLRPGQTVIAIGSPLGDFKNSVTVGVVSATGRMLDTGLGYEIQGLIQTDAAINSGNSGGPLVNLKGEIIGINTLVIRGDSMGGAPAEGLGFAIPTNTVSAVVEQLIQKGYFSRPYLGINMQPITPDLAAMYNLQTEWGAYVTSISSDSPARQAGMQQGDIIIKIGDIHLDEDNTFANALFSYSPGETIDLEVVRQSQTIKLQVTLGESKPG